MSVQVDSGLTRLLFRLRINVLACIRQRCFNDYSSQGTPGTLMDCSICTTLTLKRYLACTHQQIHILTVQLTSLVPFPLNFVFSGRELSPANVTPAQRCWQHNPSEIKTNLARVYSPFSHFAILQLCCLCRKAK